MYKICGLFVMLGVLGDFAFCEVFNPFPYQKETNQDYTGRLFSSLFNTKEIPNETRNLSISTPLTTPKPTTPTTETVVYYPIYQEPIYDPNPNYYPIIPPYPAIYNAPIDSRLQYDNLAPYYPVVNGFPSIYSNGGIPVPFLNPAPINAVPEKVISQPISPYALPTNVQPPSAPISPPQSENTGNVVTDEDRNALANEVAKLISEFYAKKMLRLEESVVPYTEKNIDTTTDDGQEEYEYKVIEPSTTNVPEVSAYPLNYPTPLVEEKVTDEMDQINETRNLNSTNLSYELVSNSSTHIKGPKVTKTTPSSAGVNHFSTETASQSEIDDSRKLDVNISEAGETSADKSWSIYPKDLIKRLKNNYTSAISKLNDRIKDESAIHNPKVHTKKFLDHRGNNCTEEVYQYPDKQYKLYTCEEKSYDGKNEILRKTTKSDVTYFTEELPPATESSFPIQDHAISNQNKKYSGSVEDIESSMLNTATYSSID